jgi:hypothetical protein
MMANFYERTASVTPRRLHAAKWGLVCLKEFIDMIKLSITRGVATELDNMEAITLTVNCKAVAASPPHNPAVKREVMHLPISCTNSMPRISGMLAKERGLPQCATAG